MPPNPAVNADARRRAFGRAGVAGYLTRWAPETCAIEAVLRCNYTVVILSG